MKDPAYPSIFKSCAALLTFDLASFFGGSSAVSSSYSEYAFAPVAMAIPLLTGAIVLSFHPMSERAVGIVSIIGAGGFVGSVIWLALLIYLKSAPAGHIFIASALLTMLAVTYAEKGPK